ncbi:hypothetical protein EYF80_014789 [Liparis tanakae]|uniref:Uncharacterized protein n=1 Tax=Liparis tanakae TaxID=230148 RepID=A0A4Z2IDC1_9TELE|nr:hypothetical protein EYF80_014789 [Liparis tanakae]
MSRCSERSALHLRGGPLAFRVEGHRLPKGTWNISPALHTSLRHTNNPSSFLPRSGTSHAAFERPRCDSGAEEPREARGHLMSNEKSGQALDLLPAASWSPSGSRPTRRGPGCHGIAASARCGREPRRRHKGTRKGDEERKSRKGVHAEK